jgi:hypothetical protein
MAKRHLTRVSIHKNICELSGSRSNSNIGYLSRREMVELLMYLKRVQDVCGKLCRLQNATVSNIIIEGKIYNESSRA